jgi:AcrR family transcriptional regulator
MKSERFTTGRIKQKQATREKILATAHQLLQTHTHFSLEDVARKLRISRATIYRYYSNVDLLYTEAVLSFHLKQPTDFVAAVQHLSLSEALLYVQRYFNQLAQQHEPMFRKYLSVVLTESIREGHIAQLRGGRRPAALEAVLRLHAQALTPEEGERLRLISSVLCGIEPLIATKDVNGLTSEASNNLLEWALQMILKGMEAEKKEERKV